MDDMYVQYNVIQMRNLRADIRTIALAIINDGEKEENHIVNLNNILQQEVIVDRYSKAI